MSPIQTNPGPNHFLWQFSAVVTWGISPIVLGEKAHRHGEISSVYSPLSNDKTDKPLFNNYLELKRKSAKGSQPKAKVVQKH
jgi:hypothetical protein